MSVTWNGPDMPQEQDRRASSKDRVLAALRAAGERGVTNLELNQIAFRYGGRIHELKAEGYDIPKPTHEGGGVYRYTLASEPARAPRPGEPGYLASLPAVASIERHRLPVKDDEAPRIGMLF